MALVSFPRSATPAPTESDGFSSGGEVPSGLREIAAARARWQKQYVAQAEEKMPPRRAHFETSSGLELPVLLTPADPSARVTSQAQRDYLLDLGLPGQFPFTRGVHPTMYRSQVWASHAAIGGGTLAEANARAKALFQSGTAHLGFALPNDAKASLCDLNSLLADIPLDAVDVSFETEGQAFVLAAFYSALADMRVVPRAKIRATFQSDCLTAAIAGDSSHFPLREESRLATNLIDFCARELPRVHAVSVNGHRLRAMGATAAQELGLSIACGIAYVEACLARNMDIDAFASHLVFSFDVREDFFEEIAKLRAARRIWARLMKRRFGARRAESMALRIHTHVTNPTPASETPEAHAIRMTQRLLASVLGGTQSFDEALPGKDAVSFALHATRAIAEESGVASSVDPLGGSYLVEHLTDALEADALETIERVDGLGGMLAAIESGVPQREISVSAARSGKYRGLAHSGGAGESADSARPRLAVDTSAARAVYIDAVIASRDAVAVRDALASIQNATRDGKNVMASVIVAAKTFATEQEICAAIRS